MLDEPVTNGQADMTSQVLKIKESGADVCNVSFYTDDAIVFANAMYANQVDLPYGIWSVGGGWQDSAFYESSAPKSMNTRSSRRTGTCPASRQGMDQGSRPAVQGYLRL